MPIKNIRGVNLRYEVVGDEGPFATLITGGRRGYDEFLPLAGKLADRGYRVLLHDRRNTGASDILMSADEVEEAVWADDLRVLLDELGEVPAFIGGSSSGARTALFFALRHPDAVRGLLLLRVTGGAFAAGRLPENYYDQFIRAARSGGMEAVCATPEYGERIAANAGNLERLMAMSVEDFIDIQTRLRDLFMAGADLPVFGVSEAELNSIGKPVVIIPGNDRVHDSNVGRTVHAMIPGSELHQLPIEDSDEPVIPFTEWGAYEAEIADTFADFMRRHTR
ncbi:MAG: alpha/beta hydrolase [Alphaproteobacteria bacterium]|nr:alpha/beta hydrolase [Alphaproteobacteria bacterium]